MQPRTCKMSTRLANHLELFRNDDRIWLLYCWPESILSVNIFQENTEANVSDMKVPASTTNYRSRRIVVLAKFEAGVFSEQEPDD
jgi:hypothetical protein